MRPAGGKADFITADIAASAEAARALARESAAALGGRIDMLLALNIRAPHAPVATIAP